MTGDVKSRTELRRVETMEAAKLREKTLVRDWEEGKQEGIRRTALVDQRWQEYSEASARGATSVELRAIAAKIRGSQVQPTCGSHAQSSREKQESPRNEVPPAMLTVCSAAPCDQIPKLGLVQPGRAKLFTGTYVQTEPETAGLTAAFDVQLEHAEGRGRLLELQALRFQEIVQYERVEFKRSLPRLVRRVQPGRRHRRYRFAQSPS